MALLQKGIMVLRSTLGPLTHVNSALEFLFTLGCMTYISAQKRPAVKLRRQALHAWRPL